MNMANPTPTPFVSQARLEGLGKWLYEQILEAASAELATVINAESTNLNAPGTAAVWQTINSVVNSAIVTALETISFLDYLEVTELPSTPAPMTWYLINVGENVYSQHLFSGGRWLNLGTTKLDLLNYWRKNELVEMTQAQLDEVIANIEATGD